MNTYQFHRLFAEINRSNLVIALRKHGYTAWQEGNELHTDASVRIVHLTYGSSLWMQF